MGGAAKSVKRGLGTRRAITAASFADSCHSDERKQVTQQVEVKNSPNESIQASRESLVFSLDYVSLRSDHPLCQGKGQLLPHCGSWEEVPGRRQVRMSGNCPRYVMNLLQETDMILPVLDEGWAGPSWEPGVL